MKSAKFTGGQLLHEGGTAQAIRGPRAKEVKAGLATFREWAGTEAESLSIEETPPGTPAVLVELGELAALNYSSKKWDGRRREYEHRTKRPKPLLCCNATGTRFFIIGGRMRATPEGIIG